MTRTRSAFVALAGLALLAPAVLSGCSSATSTAAEASPTCPDGKIAFGIEPFEDPEKLEAAYRAVADSISTALDCPVEVEVLEDYSAEVLAMENGKLDLGQFGPLGYVFASQRAGAEPLVSFGLADGTLSSYTAGIWVPKDSTISSIADLRDKDLALGSVGSTSGDVLPRSALADAGVAEDALNMNYTGGHPEALLALVNGSVDAAQINSQTLATATAEGTFEKSDFRQVWTSEAIPNDPITVNKDADPAFKEAVKKALMDVPTEDYAKIGAFLDVTPPGSFIPVTKDTYAPLFELAKTMKLTEEDV